MHSNDNEYTTRVKSSNPIILEFRTDSGVDEEMKIEPLVVHDGIH